MAEPNLEPQIPEWMVKIDRIKKEEAKKKSKDVIDPPLKGLSVTSK
jgi:hypothetical protein